MIKIILHVLSFTLLIQVQMIMIDPDIYLMRNVFT